MGEHTAEPSSPIPVEPSVESVRLLRRRQRGNRAGMNSFAPRGVKLAMVRGLLRVIARLSHLPRSIRSTTERYGAGRTGVWIRAENAGSASGVLLFVHGGGFVLPSVHNGPGAQYSKLTGLPVFLPNYRLAPENPFPAAADDVLAAYWSLLDRGFRPEAIRLVGDSSGGFLATTLLGDIARSGMPMPGAVLLLSPLVDLTAASAYRRDELSRDPASAPHFIEVTSKAYLGYASSTDSRLDVLGMDKRDWPPVLIQTGGTECLTTENQQLAESIRAAGDECELQIWPGQIHCFPLVGRDKIPEAVSAREYGASFLTR